MTFCRFRFTPFSPVNTSSGEVAVAAALVDAIGSRSVVVAVLHEPDWSDFCICDGREVQTDLHASV